MNKSDSITKLADALVKAQAEMPAAKMDGNNPFFKSKYATLGSVIDTARPILAKYGLAVSQPTVSVGDGVGVETILLHTSGEYISNVCCIPIGASGKVAQEAGSDISYLRRYGLASILGIYSDEDIDGESPIKPEKKAKAEQTLNGAPVRPWTPEYLREYIGKRVKETVARPATPEKVGQCAAMIEFPFCNVDNTEAEGIRHSITKYLIGKTSLKEATGPEISVLMNWLKPTQDSGGMWLPDNTAERECESVWTAAQLEAGQQPLIP